jgi:hypothetical protein
MRLAVFAQRRWGAETNHVLEGKFKATPTNNDQLATHSSTPARDNSPYEIFVQFGEQAILNTSDQ